MASKIARQLTQLLLANDALSPLGSKRALEVIDRAIQGKTIFKSEVDRLLDESRQNTYRTSINLTLSKQIREAEDKLREAESLLNSSIETNNDLLRTNSELKKDLESWKKLAIDWAEDAWQLRFRSPNFLNYKIEDLHTKLWNAEQEIHDLKYQRERAEDQYVWVEKVQDNYISSLEFNLEDDYHKIENLKLEVDRYREAFDSLARQYLDGMLDYLALQNTVKVIHIADEIKPDSEPLIPPPCLKPLDAMKWSEQTMFASEVR